MSQISNPISTALGADPTDRFRDIRRAIIATGGDPAALTEFLPLFNIRQTALFHRVPASNVTSVRLFQDSIADGVTNVNAGQVPQHQLYYITGICIKAVQGATRSGATMAVDANSAAARHVATGADNAAIAALLEDPALFAQWLNLSLELGTLEVSVNGRRVVDHSTPGLFRYQSGEGLDGFTIAAYQGTGSTTATTGNWTTGVFANNGVPIASAKRNVVPFFIEPGSRLDGEIRYPFAIPAPAGGTLRVSLEGLYISPANNG